MKQIKTLLLIAAIMFTVAACKKDKYDDTDLQKKIEEQQKRIDELEKQKKADETDDGTGSTPETENVFLKMKDQVFINYCKARGFDGGDGILSPKEAAAVTYIDLHYKRITSLAGIEYFTGLTWLDCSENELTELDVSKNTALTYLDCWANDLTVLDVSKNTALIGFFCSANNLTSLDLSKNTALAHLECWGNKLTSLDLSKNIALTQLDCDENKLTSLDLSKNTALAS